jgi:hypothetical protein
MPRELAKPGTLDDTFAVHEPDSTPKGFNRTFFRGEQCNFYPYDADFKRANFIEKYVLKGIAPETPPIDRGAKITAFGSCFAQNIANHLAQAGYDLSRDRAPDIHISTMGEGLVNVHAINGQFDWALNGVAPPADLWHGFHADAYGCNEELRDRTRAVMLETDFFILTLGLSEVWYDSETGGVFWRAVPKDKFEPTRHRFRVCTMAETKDAIAAMYATIRRHVPNARVLFTLSPVTLAATFRPVCGLVANSASKAIIRAALDEFYREQPDAFGKELFYWPSYEIVTQLFDRPFLEDRRHVRPEILDFIMTLFESAFCKGGATLENAKAKFAAAQ